MRASAEKLLKLYKYLVSPLLPPACRFVPSCSEYAAEAVARHGCLRGSLLAGWRVLRFTWGQVVEHPQTVLAALAAAANAHPRRPSARHAPRT